MRQQSCDEHAARVAGCPECQRRARNYQKRRDWMKQHNLPTSAGAETVRSMLRELRAAGYGLDHLSAATGIVQKQLWELSSDHLKFVQLRTFHAVEKAYRELSPFPGPSKRARTIAAQKGWTPPEPLPMPSDAPVIDPVVVERLIAGQRVKASKHERMEAFRVLLERGWLPNTIGKHLRIGGTRVNEILERLADAS